MIYLDNNATTPIAAEAVEAMLPFLTECWANPSSGYRFAKRAKEAVALARVQVAGLLGCEVEEVIFTSGGTESSNAAIRSAVALNPERRHIVTCATEHEATLAPCEALEAAGYEVTRLGVDAGGRIDLAEYEAALRPGQTALVSLMLANNETGVLQPVAEAAEIAHRMGILFHSDIVQAVGKARIALRETRIHYASLSGHKFHAPKGVGALYVNRNAGFRPFMLGGGQEAGRRSGTENVPHIVALGAAAEAARLHLEEAGGAVRELRDSFEAGLRSLDGAHVNGHPEHRLANTSNCRFDGVDAQGMIILLDNAGVCVSTGSACHTGSLKPSPVLTAMALPARAARESVRFSFSRYTTRAEVDAALEAVASGIRKLRVTRK